MTEYSKEEQKAHRKELVAVLRSGKYQQGMGRLRRGDNYCCLGVACDLAGEVWHTTIHDKDLYLIQVGYILFESAMTPKTQDYFGFYAPNGGYAGSGKSLIHLNDHKLYTFEQIADIIESEPKGLFNE